MITKKKPQLNRKAPPKNDTEHMQDDIKKYQALDALSASEGGQILLDGLMSDIVSGIDNMTTNWAVLTHMEYVGIASQIKERLDLVRVLLNSKTNKLELIDEMLPKKLKDDANKLFEEHEAMRDPNTDK